MSILYKLRKFQLGGAVGPDYVLRPVVKAPLKSSGASQATSPKVLYSGFKTISKDFVNKAAAKQYNTYEDQLHDGKVGGTAPKDLSPKNHLNLENLDNETLNKVLNEQVHTSYEKLKAHKKAIGEGEGTFCAASARGCDTDVLSPYFKNLGVPYKTLYSILKDVSPAEFDLDGNNSVDTWETPTILQKRGLATIKKGADVKNAYELPVGTYILSGDASSRITRNNAGKNNYPSHTRLIVGYDDIGKPLIYSMGQVEPYHMKDDDIIMILKGRENFTRDNLMKLSKEKISTFNSKMQENNPVTYNFREDYKIPQTKIAKGATEILPILAKEYNVDPNAVRELAQYLPGIAMAESKFKGLNSSRSWTDNAPINYIAKPIAKAGRYALNSAINLTKEEGYQQPQWRLELQARNEFPTDIKAYNKRFNELVEQNSKLKVNTAEVYSPSRGPFSLKGEVQNPEVAKNIDQSKLYGFFTGDGVELQEGAKQALAILTSNYAIAKKKYPDASHEELKELALIGYQNQAKMKNEEFFNAYIKRSNRIPGTIPLRSKYLETVKGYSTQK